MGKNQFITRAAVFGGILASFLIFFTVRAQNAPEFTPGNLVRSTHTGIYYVGEDQKLHPFTSLAVYHTWYEGFSDIQVVNEALIRSREIGTPVCVKPGTWLLKFRGIPRVYAVEPGCSLRPIRSETEAFVLYGNVWNKRIVELDPIDGTYYSVRGFAVSGKKDMDADGVPAEVEVSLGSSDSDEDTDHDKLSDFEEIYYWKSDPRNDDTDNDDVSDGDEVQHGYSPVGPQKIQSMPSGYLLPRGAYDGGSFFEPISSFSISSEESEDSYDAGKPSVIRGNALIAL